MVIDFRIAELRVGHIYYFSNLVFVLFQLSYWLHLFPELYFLKVRKEDIPNRVQDYLMHLGFIAAAYFLQ